MIEWLIRGRTAFKAISVGALPISLYMIFLFAPREAQMGDVQRIFYVHVAAAWNAFLFFGIVALCSLIYLRRRDESWNAAAKTAAELGVLFTTLTLLAGSLWARPIWNVWWTWDPRLTTTLILWFIYIGYLVLQAGAKESLRQRRFAALFGIVGFLDIPLIHFSVQLWRSIHPSVIRSSGTGMPSSMFITLLVTVAAFTVLGLALWGERLQAEHLSERVEALREEVLG